jgi:hypothetical protein
VGRIVEVTVKHRFSEVDEQVLDEMQQKRFDAILCNGVARTLLRGVIEPSKYHQWTIMSRAAVEETAGMFSGDVRDPLDVVRDSDRYTVSVRNPDVLGGKVDVLPQTFTVEETPWETMRRRMIDREVYHGLTLAQATTKIDNVARQMNDTFQTTDKIATAMSAGTIKPVNKILARMIAMLDEEKATMLAKNSDYANSDTDPLKNFRLIELAGVPALDGALARMSDKFIRVMNLRAKQKSGATVGVPSEGIKDTLLDLSNYARICRLLVEEEEEKV